MALNSVASLGLCKAGIMLVGDIARALGENSGSLALELV